MLKDSDIFNEQERRLLYAKKPELRPEKVPSLKDAKTMHVPSLNDVVLLEKPSVDQIIIEFLKQYEVNVKPRSVGVWNGWDTLSTLSVLFAREGSTLNISSTMFMANRSNQVNSAAQDWGTWKRWALDHKNFEQYKEDVIQTINLHNENLIKEVEERIRKAKLHNKNAIKDIKKSIREKELYNSNLAKKLQEQRIKDYVSKLVQNDNLQFEKSQKKTKKIFGIFVLTFISISLISVILQRPKLSPLNREKMQLIKNSDYKNDLKAKLFLDEGNKAFNSRDYVTAKYWYRKALKLDENLKGANYPLALIAVQGYGNAPWDKGKAKYFCEAKNYLRKITINDLDFKRARLLLGKIEASAKNYYCD